MLFFLMSSIAFPIALISLILLYGYVVTDLQLSCTPSSPNLSASPVQKPKSAIMMKAANNARKSVQAGPAEIIAFPTPLSRPIQSNQLVLVPERTDHEYSCLKRTSPPEQLQPRNRIKRTRRFQAEQNRKFSILPSLCPTHCIDSSLRVTIHVFTVWRKVLPQKRSESSRQVLLSEKLRAGPAAADRSDQSLPH